MSSEAPSSYPTLVEGFGYVPCAPAIWRRDDDGGLEYRDLSLRSASQDKMVATHLRAAGQARELTDLVSPDAPFVFVFIIAGTVGMQEEGGERAELGRYAAATRHGAGRPARWRLSPDAEIFLIASPAAAKPSLGVDSDAPMPWKITHESEDAYVLGEGPRAYFRYRDLGVSEATGRRVHIHMVAATRSMDGGTGWHHHTMGQIFFVLRGWADLAVERRPWVRMGPYDAMCLSAGMAHDVPAFAADYLVLEMCVPADYDTTDVPADSTGRRV
jgi:mannose-6-phosphate isomerase-like protein (cupin superfamily)